MVVPTDFEEGNDFQICGTMWADNFGLLSRISENLEEMLQDIDEEAGRWDLLLRVASLWWTSTSDEEGKRHNCHYKRWTLQIHLWGKFQELGMRHESARKDFGCN